MPADSRLSLARIDTARIESVWRVLAAMPAKQRVDEAELGINDLAAALQPLFGQPAWLVAAMLEAVLAERGAFAPAVIDQQKIIQYTIERHYGDTSPELVWSGEMGPPTSRMTKWVIEDLFRSASHEVLIAGYSFDGAKHLFDPLFDRAENLAKDGLPLPKVRIILDCSRVKVDSASTHSKVIARQAGEKFKKTCWTRPTLPAEFLYYGPSAIREPAYKAGESAFAPNSMHAKCIVVDGTTALVGSANFSKRGVGNKANVEVGALIRDHHFVQSLLAAWGAIEDELLVVPE